MAACGCGEMDEALMEKGLPLFCGACGGRMPGFGEVLKSELSRPVKLSELWLCCRLFGVVASAPCGGLAAVCTSVPCPPPGHSHAQAARRVGRRFAAPSSPPPAGDSCSSVTLSSSSSSAPPACVARGERAGTRARVVRTQASAAMDAVAGPARVATSPNTCAPGENRYDSHALSPAWTAMLRAKKPVPKGSKARLLLARTPETTLLDGVKKLVL